MNGYRFAVLGAGISGLSLAWNLKKKYPAASITVLEKSERVGGWIRTEAVDDFLFEFGPRSCRTKGNGLYTLRLIEEFGLQEEVITPDPLAHTRYLVEDNQLKPLPGSLKALLFSPYLPQLFKAICRDLSQGKREAPDESVYDFSCRHLGKEVAERFIDPLTLGIFAGDCRQLSVSSCFPLWKKWERTHGSLILGAIFGEKAHVPESPWIKKMQGFPFFSFRKGMGTLVEALAEKLHGCIRLNTGVKSLVLQGNGVDIHTEAGIFQADRIFSTLPSHALNLLLGQDLLVHPAASLAVVCLGYKKNILAKQGFGYLIPTKEKESVLGMVWDSSVFPQQNSRPAETRLTLMIAAAPSKNYQKIALDTVVRHLDYHEPPDTLVCKMIGHAIPQYPVGYHLQMEDARRRLALWNLPLRLLGTSFHNVAVNDCIASAYEEIRGSNYGQNRFVSSSGLRVRGPKG